MTTTTTYKPALCLKLWSTRPGLPALRVIFAADGTELAHTCESEETVPRWVRSLVELGPVTVSPGEYRQWKAGSNPIP